MVSQILLVENGKYRIAELINAEKVSGDPFDIKSHFKLEGKSIDPFNVAPLGPSVNLGIREELFKYLDPNYKAEDSQKEEERKHYKQRLLGMNSYFESLIKKSLAVADEIGAPYVGLS